MDLSYPSNIQAKIDMSETEERIIDGARKCFEGIGVANTRLGDIAKRAGVSRQTIYKHFSGKEDIIDRIGFLEMVKVNKVLRERIQRDLPFPDKLTHAIVASVEVSQENPYLRKVIEDAQLMPRFPDKDVSLYLWQRSRWNNFLERAQKAGELAPDLDLDEVVHWILFSQLALMTAQDRSVLIETNIHDFVRRFIVAPLLNERTEEDAASSYEFRRLQEENRALKGLVAHQAVEIHRLLGGTQKVPPGPVTEPGGSTEGITQKL